MSTKQLFDELKNMALKLHIYTWCIIKNKAVPTSHLIYNECSKCNEYILNEGYCDPL